MKLRSGFVANSSSSSFALVTSIGSANRALAKASDFVRRCVTEIATLGTIEYDGCIVPVLMIMTHDYDGESTLDWLNSKPDMTPEELKEKYPEEYAFYEDNYGDDWDDDSYSHYSPKNAVQYFFSLLSKEEKISDSVGG